MHLHRFACFTHGSRGGNLAPVVEGGPPDPLARAALARQRALTCVFIDPADSPELAAVLDFVYPHMRSPLCLHATLAAATLLFSRDPAVAPVVRTAMHGQRLSLSHQDSNLFVGLTRQDAPSIDIDIALAARLLDAPGLALASPPAIASVGSPKLLLEVADPDTLYRLAPDLSAIAAWGREHGVNGCYVWCRRPDGDYEGRNFNHLDPLLEDSATGVAAGALTVLLGHGLTVHQGRATGRDCLLRTQVRSEDILVGGLVRALGTA
ncbi:PhzF family phenazine biosynthesis protein [Massilia sp. Dwa41.01b]|nr:PhzF family phenazine biosynthesis protein [Massilia sp. Dwa41.01b]